jgi:hypothetical protein
MRAASPAAAPNRYARSGGEPYDVFGDPTVDGALQDRPPVPSGAPGAGTGRHQPVRIGTGQALDVLAAANSGSPHRRTPMHRITTASLAPIPARTRWAVAAGAGAALAAAW